MTDKPLIWTSRGNVLAESLRYEHEWVDTPDEIVFMERWYAEDGEMVKNNCHMLAKKQMTIGGQQAVMQ